MVKCWLCRLDHRGCKNQDDLTLEVMIPKKPVFYRVKSQKGTQSQNKAF